MKKLILMTLLLVVFWGESAAGKPRSEFDEFVRNVKKKITIERSYKIETEEELVLAPGQAARLNFKDNPAGVKEFIFFYDGETVHIIYRCTDDTEKEYNATHLDSERLKDYRGILATGAVTYLNIYAEWEPKDEQAFVRFRTELPSEQTRQNFRKQQKEREEKKRWLEKMAFSVREWDLEENIKPLNIIMDDPNDPNMVKLRKQYGLEGLVSKAKDDYEKLRLITGWVQKQWKHHGDNKPSRSDPLTILKEASEGKRFRCVEYAILVAACARSLGMPSRKLALKRPDVETAKSGAGHVVAEVWLEQFNKWVFVDGQWGLIPEVNGMPFNAVELQQALAEDNPKLIYRTSSVVYQKHDYIPYSSGNRDRYTPWIAPLLYYFDFNLDQRFFAEDYEKRRYSPERGKVMLVPKGAKKPKVFQRKTPIKNCTYISNPKAFYPQMNR